ncbi:hypothetical protein D3C78_1487970 [compost metagenome]
MLAENLGAVVVQHLAGLIDGRLNDPHRQGVRRDLRRRLQAIKAITEVGGQQQTRQRQPRSHAFFRTDQRRCSEDENRQRRDTEKTEQMR